MKSNPYIIDFQCEKCGKPLQVNIRELAEKGRFICHKCGFVHEVEQEMFQKMKARMEAYFSSN